MTKFILFLIVFLLILFPFPFSLFPAYAAPDLGPKPAGLTEIEDVFKRFISLFVGFAFVALVVMLFIAGVKYLTSAGEPKAVQSAAQTVTWALLGLMFLVIAWLVLNLVVAFSGIQGVTSFDIRALCNVGGVDICPK